MDDRGLLDLIIRRIPGLSYAEQVLLCTKFDREADLTVLSRQDIGALIGRNLRPPTEGRTWTMDGLRNQAEQDAHAARFRGIRYVPYVSSDYPPLLRELFDPPPVLFYRGCLPDQALPMAAVVGTRRPSGPAAAQAYAIAQGFAWAGVPVVSGLALGIDAMAHRGAVEGGGLTIAVLGSGLDEVYPRTNRMLARRIIETGGALVSEYPPGTGPMKWHFPARNRIIAGLSRGTVIVEAPARSGALITAQFALEQGRDLWVASMGVASPTGEGTRKLAADGSRVISAAAAILREWGIESKSRASAGARNCATGAALASSLANSLNIDVEGM
ncbi:DNA processing protein DprA [Spirochaetia bacterium]|nr:DNA processing protein DprA [Spirochaetia bacterium]